MLKKLKTQKGFLVLTLGVGLFLFLITTGKSGPRSIIATLGAFTIWDFLVIVAIFLVQYLFSTISISHILKKFNHPIAIKKLFPLELMRASISYVTPFSNNGGEPLEIYLLKKRYAIPYSAASAAIILEIILKIAVSLIFTAVGCGYIFLTTASPLLKTILFSLLLFFLVLIIAFFYYTIQRRGFFSLATHYFGLKKFAFFQKNKKVIHNIDRCIIYYLHHYPRDFPLTILLAFLNISCYILRFYLIILFLGYASSFLELILIFSLTQALILIPIPTLLGIHELGQGLLSLITNVPLGTGISFVIILRIITLVMTIPGFILLGHQSINGLGQRLKDKIFFRVNHKLKNPNL
ncbi:MAG: lysylphosphatidylglycerol synthase transmembrane domain-containing protein [Candidatus Doudnabacteria bacterium]